MKYFTGKLNNSKSSADERAMCIRAFGPLAKTVVIFLGATELYKLLLVLLENCERIYAG